MRFRKFSLYIVLLLIILKFIGYPFWDTLKSYGIMYTYNKHMEKHNYLNKHNILFHIPGGISTPQKDWYPFILSHDASSSFSSYLGREITSIILYSFGSFDFMKGSSNFYNPSSPYQGAFYGGYALFNEDQEKPPFGYKANGELDIKEIQAMPLFDQTKLVLPSIGSPKESIIFKSTITSIERKIPYIQLEGWTKIDADIITNAPTHSYKGKRNLGYIQYGKPHKSFSTAEDFPLINLKGRIYIKYIQELNGTFMLYILAKNQEVINECDKSLLSHSIIKQLDQ